MLCPKPQYPKLTMGTWLKMKPEGATNTVEIQTENNFDNQPERNTFNQH